VPENSLTITIVIPAYNEARHIAACLDSIAAQTIMPDEVIVVDNNSTDGTADVAKKYPFVTLLHESKRGLIPARNRGFADASGQILGRINADAAIATDWVARVKTQFSSDKNLGGLTGLGFTHTPVLHLGSVQSTLCSLAYLSQSDAYFRVRLLWGANMAVRADAWHEIKSDACTDDALVHEDQDVSILLAGHGWKTRRDNNLTITANGDHYFMWPKFKEYMRRRWQTKARHNSMGTLKKPGAQTLSFLHSKIIWLFLCIGFPVAFGAASFIYWHALQLINLIKLQARRLPELLPKIN
jgi:glycosyltransferase involved in cell wall biosynthesis